MYFDFKSSFLYTWKCLGTPWGHTYVSLVWPLSKRNFYEETEVQLIVKFCLIFNTFMTETDTKLHWHDSAIKKVEWWPKIPSKEIHYWMVWKLKSIGIERKGKKVWFAKCKMSYFEEEPSFWFPPLLPYQWLKDLVRKQQIGFAFSPQDPQQTCYCSVCEE